MHHENGETNAYPTPRARPALAALALAAAGLAAACDEPEPPPALLSSEPELELRTSSWEEFPIILDGVAASQITDYTYDLGGTIIGLEDIIDVVTYYTRFQPCDLASDAARASLGYDRVESYIDAASAKELAVLVPLPYLGGYTAVCDGQVVLDGEGKPIELWSHDGSVRIPISENEITTAYVAYWSDKVDDFITAVDAYDVDDVVWSWRGFEELRYWTSGDVELSRAMRDAVDTYDGTRGLTAYTPNHYMPESTMINTLLDRPIPSLSPYNPLSVTLDPADPVARFAVTDLVEDLYPRTVEVNLDPTGALRPVFDHIVTGAYTGWLLGTNGHVNRIHPLHRAHLGRETRENLEAVYAANGQTAPEPIVFHVPDLTQDGVVHMSREEARHDFWAGLHVAEGIFIHSFGYRDLQPDVWDAYARGLYLIKSEMRPWLAQGNRWTPAVWSNGVVQTVPGDDYLTLYPGTPHLALPQAPDAEYPTLNATIVAMMGTAYLIVTNSWNQPVDFEVSLPACTLGAEVAHGETDDLSVVGNTLMDSFAGIDGRVYRVFFAAC